MVFSSGCTVQHNLINDESDCSGIGDSSNFDETLRCWLFKIKLIYMVEQMPASFKMLNPDRWRTKTDINEILNEGQKVIYRWERHD